MESGSVERLAKNESFYRQVNERIKDVGEGFEGHETYEFLRECSDQVYTERITLDHTDYEWVRSDPTRFVLARGLAARVAAKLDLRTA